MRPVAVMATVAKGRDMDYAWRAVGEAGPCALAELVGEVPGPEITRFQADKKIVAGALGVSGSGLGTEVARGNAPYRTAGSCGGEPGVAAHLDSAVGRGGLADHDAGPGISPQLRRSG